MCNFMLLERVCTAGQQRTVKAGDGVDSYSITLCTEGRYSFTLKSFETSYTRTCETASELQGALLEAVANMGADDPADVVEEFMAFLAPAD